MHPAVRGDVLDPNTLPASNRPTELLASLKSSRLPGL